LSMANIDMNSLYKLVVVSDSHHDFARLERLLPVINSANYMIFCGDGIDDIMRIRGLIAVPIVCVRGNNDFGSEITELATTRFGDTRVLIAHGHRHGVRRGLDMLMNEAISKRCNLVFFGHTHAFFDREVNSVHFINPGALCGGSYAVVVGDGLNFSCAQRTI